MIIPLTDENGDILTDEFGNALTYDDGLASPVPVAARIDHYSIDLCVGWSKIAECPAGMFNAISRNLAIGEWRLEGAVNAVDLEAGYDLTDVDTVLLVRGKQILFGGYVTPVEAGAVGGLEIVSQGRGAQFTLSGPDVWAALASRVAYPNPAADPPWVDSHDARSGVASTVAASYIDANLGPGALSARQIPGVTVVDGLTGLSGSWSARLQRLDQLVARICRDGGIVCRPTVNFAGALRIFLVGPQDRSSTTVLSDQGDLTNIQRQHIPATDTYVIAGGAGELTARTFRQAGSATGVARRESFHDQSSLSFAAEVQQAADTKVAAGVTAWSVRAELTVGDAQQLVLFEDYDIGDLISVEIDNVRHVVPVEAITFEIAPTRKVVRPVLGVAAPNVLAGLIRDVAGLHSRFSSSIA